VSRRCGWPASFDPGAFAFVMATGIVSIAARMLGYTRLGAVLFGINAAAYLLLWTMLVGWIASSPRSAATRLARHETGPAFLSIIAATSVLGSQCGVFGVASLLLPWLFALAVVLWVGLLYPFLAAVTLAAAKPGLGHGLSGSWLLIVVSTQSLSILGSYLAADAALPPALLFFCLACYLLGGMLFILLQGLILYRFAFVPMPAAELSGPWWINMGAAAISTLAGGRLIALPTGVLHLAALQQFVEPFTLMFWAAATFWLPLLVVLFAWKHLVVQVPVRYETGQWSVVFPLGMYAAATHEYASAAGFPFLEPLAAAFCWIAPMAWLAAFIGLLRALLPTP